MPNVNIHVVVPVRTTVQNVNTFEMENIACLNVLIQNMIKMEFVYSVMRRALDVPVPEIRSVQMVAYHARKQLSAKE